MINQSVLQDLKMFFFFCHNKPKFHVVYSHNFLFYFPPSAKSILLWFNISFKGQHVVLRNLLKRNQFSTSYADDRGLRWENVKLTLTVFFLFHSQSQSRFCLFWQLIWVFAFKCVWEMISDLWSVINVLESHFVKMCQKCEPGFLVRMILQIICSKVKTIFLLETWRRLMSVRTWKMRRQTELSWWKKTLEGFN